jgi:hypothetical protein
MRFKTCRPIDGRTERVYRLNACRGWEKSTAQRANPKEFAFAHRLEIESCRANFAAHPASFRTFRNSTQPCACLCDFVGLVHRIAYRIRHIDRDGLRRRQEFVARGCSSVPTAGRAHFRTQDKCGVIVGRNRCFERASKGVRITYSAKLVSLKRRSQQRKRGAGNSALIVSPRSRRTGGP